MAIHRTDHDDSVILTADTVLFSQTDDGTLVLLIERGKDPFRGQWALPGGYVDAGEAPAQAAVRELREETGIRIDGIVPVGVYDAPGRDPRGPLVSHAFTAILDHTPQATAGDDAAAARWLPIHEALDNDLAFDHFTIIIDALRTV